MRIVGRYELGEPIGHGGMAVVYLARQIDLDRLVALKELRVLGASHDPDQTERFLREAKMAGALSHPNIVSVIEHFEHEGKPYIAMEYLERGSLRPWIGRMTLAQIAGVLEGLLTALDHAAQYGIVHRDLKPENVLITAQGQVKIADFGIAKARTMNPGTLTVAGSTVGTPTYMAPEQAMAQELGAYTDLYSIGVMAYEMFVGRVPFDDPNPFAVAMRHVHDEIPSAHTVRPNVDPALSDWIDRLLIKDPATRTQSPEVAWDELETFVAGQLGSVWRREARLLSPSGPAAPLPPAPAPAPIDRDPRDEDPDAPPDGYEEFDFDKPVRVVPTPPPKIPPTPRPARSGQPPAVDPQFLPPPRVPSESGYLTYEGLVASTAPEQVDKPKQDLAVVTPPPAVREPTPPPVEALQAPTETPDPMVVPEALLANPLPTPPELETAPAELEDAPLDEAPAELEDTPAPLDKASAELEHAPALGGAELEDAPAPLGEAEPEDAPTPLGEAPAEAAEAPAALVVEPAPDQRSPAVAPPPGPASSDVEARTVMPDAVPALAPSSPRKQSEAPAETSEPKVATPPSSDQIRRRRLALIGGCSGLAVAAVIAVVVVGGGGGGGDAPTKPPTAAKPRSRELATPDLVLTMPASSWTPRAEFPAVPGLHADDGKAAEQASGAFVAAELVRGDADATLLPAGLLSRLKAKLPEQQTVTLGGRETWVYDGVSVRGAKAKLRIYATLTDAGVATVACANPATAADCDTVAASLRLKSAHAIAVGATPAYEGLVKPASTMLDGRIANWNKRLDRAKTLKGKSRAVGRIGHAYTTATALLGGANAKPAASRAADALNPVDAGLNTRLTAAFERMASTYAKLARAIAKRDVGAKHRYERTATRTRARIATIREALIKAGYTGLLSAKPRTKVTLPARPKPRYVAAQPSTPQSTPQSTPGPQNVAPAPTNVSPQAAPPPPPAAQPQAPPPPPPPAAVEESTNAP